MLIFKFKNLSLNYKLEYNQINFYYNNKLHRKNNPTVIHYYKSENIFEEYYCINNRYHRKDGPAIIQYYNNGNISGKYYYIDGILQLNNF